MTRVRPPARASRGASGVPRALLSALLPALALVLAAGLAPAARAGTEEFSTFDVERQEEDDESLLDHLLTRPPRAWRDEWERSAQALRTAQGCLTSGQWFIETDLKVAAPLGERARFGFELRQSETDVSNSSYADFRFLFPTRIGTPGVSFRPLYDKSRQDLALTWEHGADTTALQVQAAFGLEDVFNNLWAFRQTRVGDASEPYEKHPFEPALRVVARRPAWRAEAAGLWLTPSRKRIPGALPGDPARRPELWGALGHASLEARALGLAWELAGRTRHAKSGETIEGVPGDAAHYRRSWEVEASARHAWGPAPAPRRASDRTGHAFGRTRWAVEVRTLYRDRDQRIAPPLAPRTFAAIDRVWGAEAQWAARPALLVRVGGLHDRITVAETGARRFPAYGTRTESRAYVGLVARFGRVNVSLVEGLELDPEPYEVWAAHDKGFLHLQTAF